MSTSVATDDADLALSLIDLAERLFACQLGQPSASYHEGDARYPYVLYVYGHRGEQDRRAELVALQRKVLQDLRDAGATRLVWRQLPEFTREDAVGSDVTTTLRMRVAAISASGVGIVLKDGRPPYAPAPHDFLRDSKPDSDGVALLAAAHPRDADTVDDEPIATELSPDSLEEMDVVIPDDDAVLLCARLCHAAVEAMNRAHNEPTLSWEESRDSVLAGVRRVVENPRETAKQNHDAWMAYRAAEGWVYGATKDPVMKTHPCMVPYAALSQFQRSKDGVFLALVRTFFGLEDRA